MKAKDIDKLLAKCLSGDISEDEKQSLDKWINSSEQNKKEFQILLYAKNATDQQKFLFKNDAFEKVIKKSEKSRARIWLAVAASITLILSLSFLYNKLNFNSEFVNSFQVTSPTLISKSTLPGQKLKVFLPDGSYAWLNAASSISYYDGFTDSSRAIQLNGEAYFKVEKDKNRPFVVRSGNSEVTALGTEFNVNAYEKRTDIEVSLFEGKVQVKKTDQKEGNTIILDPGELAKIPRNDNYISKSFYDEINLNWKNGVLYFKEASFETVVYELEKWYGVTVHYNQKPVTKWHFTGTFENEPLERVLKVLSFAEKFHYEYSDGKVRIVKYD